MSAPWQLFWRFEWWVCIRCYRLKTYILRLHCDIKHGHLQRLKPGMLTKPAMSKNCQGLSQATRLRGQGHRYKTRFRRSLNMLISVFSSVFIVLVFSELELMFMFAICRRPSVCLSSVCLSVVCLFVTFVHPTQPIEIFGAI